MVLTVLALPMFLLCVALVTDMGHLFVARSLALAAADLGALAGAQDLDLERLAAGEPYIDPLRARLDAERWTRDNLVRNFGSQDEVRRAEVQVDVYNASEASPAWHRLTGRRLIDPTVCVQVRMPVRLFFLAAVWPEATVAVHADASVVKRRRDASAGAMY